MENNPNNIKSPLLSRPTIKKHFEQLEHIVDKAQKRIDYSTAHDEEILKAIEVVERFLRKNRRVCYGGQAINALLPQKRKFYDERYTIPDYDFFSPDMESDSDELVNMLLEEGFEDVNKKVGVHDGTMKIMVNFIAVADCSSMHPTMFDILQKRAHVVNGILYCDPDFLRMMMYLELSRPRGEIDRWKKVYERLTLLNNSYPVSDCYEKIRVDQGIRIEDRKVCIDFCQSNRRVLVGPEVIDYLEHSKGITHKESLVKRGGPVLILTEKAEQDANDIRDILLQTRKGVKVDSYEVYSDSLFPFSTITRKGERIAILFQEEACHGYVNLKFKEGGEIRIGHPDLLLHLYYSLSLFGRKEKTFFQTSLECLIGKLYGTLKKIRGSSTEFLPAFSLRCSGRQKGLATLLKLKAQRTAKEKKRIITNSKKNTTKTKKVKRVANS